LPLAFGAALDSARGAAADVGEALLSCHPLLAAAVEEAGLGAPVGATGVPDGVGLLAGPLLSCHPLLAATDDAAGFGAPVGATGVPAAVGFPAGPLLSCQPLAPPALEAEGFTGAAGPVGLTWRVLEVWHADPQAVTVTVTVLAAQTGPSDPATGVGITGAAMLLLSPHCWPLPLGTGAADSGPLAAPLGAAGAVGLGAWETSAHEEAEDATGFGGAGAPELPTGAG
jgi:hypothetical protein